MSPNTHLKAERSSLVTRLVGICLLDHDMSRFSLSSKSLPWFHPKIDCGRSVVRYSFGDHQGPCHTNVVLIFDRVDLMLSSYKLIQCSVMLCVHVFPMDWQHRALSSVVSISASSASSTFVPNRMASPELIVFYPTSWSSIKSSLTWGVSDDTSESTLLRPTNSSYGAEKTQTVRDFLVHLSKLLAKVTCDCKIQPTVRVHLLLTAAIVSLFLTVIMIPFRKRWLVASEHVEELEIGQQE